MNKSGSIAALSAALAKAQGEVKNPHFDSTNPHFKSKFASLGAVREAVIPVLTKHGLSMSQWPISVNGSAGCRTLLTHSSGEWLEEEFLIPVDKHNAHGYASAVTYSKRIAMQSVAGVVGDEDDDGNQAVGDNVKGERKDAPGKGPTITPVTGMFESLPIDMQNAVMDIVYRTESLFKRGDEAGAWDEWSASIRAISEEPHGDVARAVAWNRMDSKVRAALAKRVPKHTKEAA